jgi:Icc-related predicted phosphoesterase
MKVLCISDIHGNRSTLGLLAPQIAEADLILVAGDFSDFGGTRELELLLSAFEDRLDRLAAVGGNCDRLAARKLLESRGVSVDGSFRSFAIGGLSMPVTVIGAGGGNFHSGFTPDERSDVDLAGAFEAALKSLDPASGGRRVLLALSHTPPYGAEADLRRGVHVGSPGLRNMLDALKPLLWVCGHIHEARSVSRCEKTLVVNPGPLREGCFAWAEIRESGGDWSVDATLHHL